MKRILSFALIVSMVMGIVLPVSGFWKRTTLAAETAFEEVEVVEMRTSCSETFLQKDGSYKTVLYSYEKYYRSETQDYIPIDDSIIPTSYSEGGTTYSYTNASDDYQVYFAEIETPKVLIKSRGKSLSFVISESGFSSAIANNNSGDAFSGINLDGNNIIKFSDSRNLIDYYYESDHRMVKEYIVLREKASGGRFSFLVSCDGCDLVDREGVPCLEDTVTHEEYFRFGELFAVDSNGSRCEGFNYNIDENSDGTYSVSFEVPQNYLCDQSRAYPVLIDPSVLLSGSSSTYDTCVDQQYPTSNYYLAESLWTGGQFGNNAMRTLIKFDLPSSISASQLTRATLRLRKREHSSPSITANRITSSWSSSTATWNNQPGYTIAECSDVCTAEGSDWYSMEVTSIVHSWLNGTHNNYGFLLREQSESSSTQKTKFYSSDANYPNRPELVLCYVNYIGSRKYQQAPYDPVLSIPQANCMGYALEYKMNLDKTALEMSNNDVIGMNTEEILNYVQTKIEAWMTNHVLTPNFGALSSYDSSINTASPGWYRVVVRVGLDDCIITNNIFDVGERFDYHWRYQTTSGYGLWADKPGNLSSIKRLGTNGLDPAASYWYSMVMVYTSTPRYYQIKDLRTVTDWEEEQ